MRPLFVAVLILCVGCTSQPHPPAQTASSGAQQAEKPATQGPEQPSPNQKAEPEQFGFNVVNVQPELCCSDTPGKPVALPHSFRVEGTSIDNWRFVLGCMDTGRLARNGWKYATKDDWYELHTASVEHEKYGDMMTIYILSSDRKGQPHWDKFVTCSIVNRLDRAKDVAPIWVTSSEAREWKDGSGYEVEALGAHEVYKLACIQSAQSPCVSVAPAWYRGVRDGSELRLCDQELKVICAYTIKSERARP